MQFYTAGFSESGDAEWADAERDMVRIAQEGGYRIIGHNCFGVYNPRHGISYGPFNVRPALGSIGLIVQSGGIMGKILEYGMVHGLGFGKGASIGNASDIGVADFLEYLALDDEIRTIGLYLEGPRDTRRLFEVIRAAAETKPVVVWMGGSSPAGDQAIFKVQQRAEEMAEEKLLDLLLPHSGKGSPKEGENHQTTREKLRKLLKAGKLNDKYVEVEIVDRNLPIVEIFSASRLEEM